MRAIIAILSTLLCVVGNVPHLVDGFVPYQSLPVNQHRQQQLQTPTPTSVVTKHSTKLYSVPNFLDTFTSGLASICRLPNGVTVVKPSSTASSSDGPTPKLLKLFDIENSRECRSVREIITELDLNVEKVIPCAPNSRAVQDKSYKYSLPQGCNAPTLVVGGNGNDEEKIIGGEEAIVRYLKSTFGYPSTTTSNDGDIQQEIMEYVQKAGSYIAGILRPGRGDMVSPAAKLEKESPSAEPLILYSYEGNQFCRLVRETLTELDIVYELRNAGKESPRRAELASITGGSSQCPYIIDPSTGTSMSESADIISYLYKTYGKYTPPNELLQWASDTIVPLISPLLKKIAPIQAGSNREDTATYQQELETAKTDIQNEVNSNNVVIYTYELSPFSTEATAVLDNLNIEYKEISLGKEWFPGLVSPDGSIKRAALLEMTGQSSLPHIFIGGKAIGGLFSGEPGLIPALNQDKLLDWVNEAKSSVLEDMKGSNEKKYRASVEEKIKDIKEKALD